MLKQSHLLYLLALGALTGACSGSGTTDLGEPASGGTTGTGTTVGGATSAPGGTSAAGALVGGTTASGGTTGVGESTIAVGGTTSLSGPSATGGTSNHSEGGATAKGGSTSAGGTSSSGGTTAKVGTSSTGGISSSGGTTAKGGTSSTGGTTAKGGTSSAGGTTAKGGTTSTGGTTTTDPSWKVDGFAATGTGTTGGGNVTPTTVTTCAQLKTALESTAAAVVHIPSGTILDCRLNPSTATSCRIACTGSSDVTTYIDRVPVTGQTCADLGGVAETNAITRYDYSINIKSNKTLRGLGNGATIRGASLSLNNVSNVIVQNIALKDINAALIEAGDGLTINSSNHVFVNHCEFSMISDGYMDVRYNSSAITISYNLMDGVAATHHDCSGQHNFISMVAEQSYVTYHHNHFYRGGGRNPKVSGTSNVHIYNNYYESISYFCANTSDTSQILVENNYYYNARYPHWDDGGTVEASGNVYAGTTTSGTGRDNTGTVFNPSYTYTLESAAALNTSVPQKAGLGTLP